MRRSYNYALRKRAKMHTHHMSDQEAMIEAIRTKVRQTYEEIGPDLWGEEIPGQSEFLDVMLDRVHSDLTPEESAFWSSLSRVARNAIVLKCGP